MGVNCRDVLVVGILLTAHLAPFLPFSPFLPASLPLSPSLFSSPSLTLPLPIQMHQVAIVPAMQVSHTFELWGSLKNDKLYMYIP